MRSKLLYNGKLEVFEDGTVYRIKDGMKPINPITTTSRNKQYFLITLMVDGKQKHLYIHRLVAEAFIDNPNPSTKTHVRHIDGNSQNNHVSNFEWVTRGESTRQAYRNGLVDTDKWKKPCVICGQLTGAEDVVCTTCKIKEKQKRKKEEVNAGIKAMLQDINFDVLTEAERETVILRRQYLTYKEIGIKMGCSKQCSEQRVNRALVKSWIRNNTCTVV